MHGSISCRAWHATLHRSTICHYSLHPRRAHAQNLYECIAFLRHGAINPREALTTFPSHMVTNLSCLFKLAISLGAYCNEYPTSKPRSGKHQRTHTCCALSARTSSNFTGTRRGLGQGQARGRPVITRRLR